MSLFAKEPESVLVNEGVHLAVCIGIFDLGTQYSKAYDVMSRKVLFMWEISDERIEVEGKDLPMAMSKRYTNSLHKKAQLRKDLESWRGKAFTLDELETGYELKDMLGKSCQLQVVHNKSDDGKVYANIAGIMALPKGVKSAEPENPLKFFSIEDGKAFPKDMPNWIKSIIEESEEYKEEAHPTEEEPPITEEEEPTDEEVKKVFEEEGITPMHSINEGLPKKRVKKAKDLPFH